MSDTVSGNRGDPHSQSELQALRSALSAEYDVLEELGRGGMAVVYLARDRQLDREVALKVLPPHLMLDAAFIERFQREGRIAAQLEHPNIVPIYRVGRQGDVIYLAMKHLRGGSLASLLKRQGQLSPSEVRRILLEVGDALDCAGSRHIVHRDIKPENILFDEAGRCVVTDFGIAKSAAETKLTGAGQSIGTPHYMSPEQARGVETDVRSDLYSLGIVAYHCLAGKVPFDAPDNIGVLYAHVTRTLPTPALPTPDHESVYRIIQSLVMKKPAERIQSGRELIAIVKGKSSAHPPTVTISPGPLFAGPLSGRMSDLAARGRTLLRHSRERWRKGARRSRALTVAGGGVLVALIAAYAGSSSGSGASLCPTASQPAFLVFMDPVPQQAEGARVKVSYDVCGLPPGTPYRAHLRLSRNEDFLKKMFGNKAKQLVVTFQDKVDGPATRRSRRFDLGSTPPGAYTLELALLDNRGRERKRLQTVVIQPE
ncbi:MAG: serine/threonine-protein kinase [Gemmatimonadales bacterium]